jgi:hypothetical protein
VSDRVRTPIATGLLRPVIVLPPELLTALSPMELRDVLVHENAHIVRRDQIVILLQAVAQAAYWPILPIHWLNRLLANAREEVCDNYVLAQQHALSYGETLLRVASMSRNLVACNSSVGMLGWRGRLEERITELIHERRNTSTRVNPFAGASILAVLALVTGGLCATTFVSAQELSSRAPHAAAERAVVSLQLVFSQDLAYRDVGGVMVDAGDHTLIFTTGSACIVPDGIPPAIDHAFLERTGKPVLDAQYDPRSNAEVFVYRAAGGLTSYQFTESPSVGVGDALDAVTSTGLGEMRVTPRATTVRATNREAEVTTSHSGVRRFKTLLEIDRGFPEGTPIFKDGRLVGMTIIGTRFLENDLKRSYVLPVERMAALCRAIKNNRTAQSGLENGASRPRIGNSATQDLKSPQPDSGKSAPRDDVPGGFGGRSGAARKQLLTSGGGNAESEACVASGLQWLVAHQSPDGHWSLDGFSHGRCNCGGFGQPNDIAATAFGLLPLLGAGESHKEPKATYRLNVERGLEYLIARQAPDGNFGGGMYAHGLATIAICEAYGLTSDPVLKTPAQRALNFIRGAQGDGGGWRYEPREAGDTSVTGWEIMALMSGQMAGLEVDNNRNPTLARASKFLNTCMTADETGYGYTSPQELSASMTAVGLLCRLYLGTGPRNSGIQGGVQRLKQNPPSSAPTRRNIYYDYYATQVMFHFGGEPWDSWNPQIRNLLVKTQDKGDDPKHPHTKGSWSPVGDIWGGGGRIMTTSLSILTLEVYYRHLPLYRR